MEERDTQYVFRDERAAVPSYDPEERDVVIMNGTAMTYRRYRRPE
ncbi:hypothetical protein ACFO0N_00035 [Halobium salinum]|uniref:Uncharacterized protein n=1 Tax=Halobium salinum TaxID=1364940 RepID=A0ABD5P621_9EURY|nr:hypothetical protein [Halobium salinum]